MAGDGAAWHKRNDGSAYPFFEPEHRPQTVMAGADISMSADASAEPKPVSGYSYYVVGFLAVVYTLNFLDRQIISILGKQISAELHLTKTQFGLLGGTSFALLYTTCGIGVPPSRPNWVLVRCSSAEICLPRIEMICRSRKFSV